MTKIALCFFVMMLTLETTAIGRALEQDGSSLAPCVWQEPGQKYWFDESHLFISEMICRPGLWFDSFFATKKHLDRSDGTSLRLFLSEKIEQEKAPIHDRRLSTKVHLPYISNRLHFIAEAEEKTLIDDVRFKPTETIASVAVMRDPLRDQHARLGLQWYFLHDDAYSLRGEVHAVSPHSNTNKLNGQYRWDFLRDMSATLGEELEKSSDVDVSVSNIKFSAFDFTQHFWLSFDKPVGESRLLRLATDVTTEGNKGLHPHLSQSVSLMDKINAYTAVSYDLSCSATNSPWADQMVQAGVNWKSRAFRHWIAVGLTPYLAMYKADGFTPKAGFLLNLEMIYGSQAK